MNNFQELWLAAQDARSRLQDLGCFSDVEIHIDTSEGGGKSDYEVKSGELPTIYLTDPIVSYFNLRGLIIMCI